MSVLTPLVRYRIKKDPKSPTVIATATAVATAPFLFSSLPDLIEVSDYLPDHLRTPSIRTIHDDPLVS